MPVHRLSVSDGSRFSLVAFALALVTVSLGTAAGLAFVPVVGTYVGTLAGAFVAGLAIENRPVLEGGVAGVIAGLGVLAAGPFVGSGIGAAVTGLAAVGPLTLLVSVALSFAVGAFGAHFGDDLRDGLTEPIGDPASGSTDISNVGVPPMTESTEETTESTEAPIDESVGRRTGESAAVDDSAAADEHPQAGEKELEYE